MAETYVRVERPAERIAEIVLDRPPVNALSREMVRQVRETAEGIGEDPSLACVLVGSRGKAFCAGADLKERKGMGDDEVAATVRGIGEMCSAVAGIPVPTIAVIGGAALGGGLELALACDLRVAAEEAKVGLPECSLGIIPGAGGTQRLARIAGPAVAKRWIFSARVAPAEEAARDGIVDVAVPGEVLRVAALTLAEEIARCGPLALRAAKRAIDGGLAAGDLAAGLAVEHREYLSILPTEDRREALRAFAEKRPPRFRGR